MSDKFIWAVTVIAIVVIVAILLTIRAEKDYP